MSKYAVEFKCQVMGGCGGGAAALRGQPTRRGRAGAVWGGADGAAAWRSFAGAEAIKECLDLGLDDDA